MLRSLVCALVVFVLGFGVALADEVKGKIKSVDADKGTITVTVGDKDQTFPVAKDAKLTLGKDVKELKDIKAGGEVSLTTGKQDGKDVVTEIKRVRKPKP